ncbi:MAG TPA: ABC transporter permease [Lachnoclostridium phytofermentans]|uniref:ABC transporter permease n=1 Tax=Lachnoclostridium phytofermentans TaxID=66219 RepID=A0A3D2X6N8_9FIRM|nr:ABC transporter permease [Lachnoclostridium sp.]HCL02554.1 ABC transporter permease [Lachnoclostridium phytofermentans]
MLKKVMIAILTILISLVVMFLVIQNMPGDPVDIMATEIMKKESVQYEIAYQRAKAILNYDPDKPLLQRFFDYSKGIISGDLGNSLAYKKSVVSIIKDALPWTLLVASLSLFLSFSVGILLGIFIAWKRKKFLNYSLIIYQSILGAIPNYVVAYLLVFLFSVTLKWLPARGAYSTSVTVGFNLPFILDVLKHAVLPVMAFFLTTVSGWILSMKANSLSILGEDYIVYAQVRGLSNRRILFSYLSKNAILPMITNLAISFGLLFGGSPLIENLFLYPGVGYFLNNAIAKRDYTLMQGMFFVIILMVVVSSLIAEFLYKYLNPRLRES